MYYCLSQYLALCVEHFVQFIYFCLIWNEQLVCISYVTFISNQLRWLFQNLVTFN